MCIVEMGLFILLCVIASLHCSSARGSEPAVLALEFDSYMVNEGESVSVCVQVTNGPLSQIITLQLSTAPLPNSRTPATAGMDYSSVPNRFPHGRLAFSSFRNLQCLSISTIADTFVEDTESFIVKLHAISFLPPTVELERINATVFILDNDEVEIGFDQSSYSANEGDDSVKVCVVVTRGNLQRSIQATMNTEDGTATAPDHYIRMSAELTINSTQERACIHIIVTEDQFHNSEMSFMVILGSNNSAVTFKPGRSNVLVHIHDNDALVIGLERGNYVVSETIRRVVNVSNSGNTTGTNATVVQQTSVRVCAVVFDGTMEAGTTVHVRLNTQSGTAIGSGRYRSDIDYTSLINKDVHIFDNGTGCVDIEVRDDDIVEGPEQFSVTLSVPSGTRGVIIQLNTATVTILDDGDVVVIGLTSVSYRVTEGNSVQVCVQILSGRLRGTVTLQLSTSSPLNSRTPATAGVDYSSVPGRYTSGQLTVSSYSSHQCRSISTKHDTIVEGTEDFLIHLRTVSLLPNVELANTNATVFILDNDKVQIGFAKSSYTANEGDDSVEVCVSIYVPGSLQRSVKATLRTEDYTATAPDDYIPASSVLTISRRDNRRHCVHITLVEDSSYDGRSVSFRAVLRSNDSAIAYTRGRGDVLVTIHDNDVLLIGLEKENYTVNETYHVNTTGGYTIQQTSVRVCAVIFEGTRKAHANAVVRFSTESGTATGSVRYGSGDYDYTSHYNNEVYISENGTGCVDIQVRDDNIAEVPEQFVVTLSVSQLNTGGIFLQPPTTATVTILDDEDTVLLGLESDSYTVAEGTSVPVCVRIRNGRLSGAIKLQIRTAASLALETSATADVDYLSVPRRRTSGQLTVNSRNFQYTCLSISTTSDVVVEGIETFLVQLQTITPLPSSVELARTNATVFILDNDHEVEIGFERSSYTATEGDDFVRVCVVIMRGSLQRPESVQVTVNTEDGTATAPGDYISVFAELIFNGTHRRCIFINLTDDEFYNNVLGGLFFAIVLESNDSAVSLSGDHNHVSVNIQDNDVLVIGLERDSYTVSETTRVVTVSSSGNTTGENTTVVQQTSVRVCAVVLNGTIKTGANVLVKFSTQRGSATGSDYTSFFNKEVTFENVTACVDVQVRDDSTAEGPEQFSVTLSSLDTRRILVSSPSTATVTILDDRDAIVFGFTQTKYSISEGNRVYASLSLTRQFAHLQLKVRIYTVDNSATSHLDYSPLNTTITTSRYSNRQIQVATIEDELDEDPETFYLRLELIENINFPIKLVEAVVTILDDDGITIGLEDSVYSVLESVKKVKICAILLRGVLDRKTAITLFTTDGSATAPADYSAIPVVLTFDESVSRSCGSIPIELDSTIETEEFFSVSITTTDPGVTLRTETARVTISDRSEAVIGFETEVYEVSEGQHQEFCVAVQNGTLELPIEVTLTTEDGTASAPDDYSSGALRITLTEEDKRICVCIPIVNDTTTEGTERFFAKLSTEDLRISLLPATAIITILDDDEDEKGNSEAAETCLPHQVATVSVRAVLSGDSRSNATGNHCPGTRGLQSPFTQFLSNEILETVSYGPGCIFLSAKLSSCATRSGRTVVAITADFTCNGHCIQASSGDPENTQTSNAHRQLLMDTIAKEHSVSTTFEGDIVRITYFRRGQQSAITAVCSAGAAVQDADENNLCNCLADCSSSKTP